MSAESTRRPGVADTLTLGNALCGAAAILVVCGTAPFAGLDLEQRFHAAALLLLCGTLLDVLDGAVARRWGGTPLGRPLDGLADGVTFGVAPVIAVVAYVTTEATSAERLVVTLGGLVYVAAALVRLADFMAHRRPDSVFVGLPTTSACVAAMYLGFLTPPPLVTTAGLVGLAALMVSPLAYPTGRRVLALSLLGWGVGLVAVIGLVDVRVPAILTIAVIVVVVPLLSHLRARAVAESPSP